MTDDALKALADSMADIRQEQEGSTSGRERAIQQYSDWLTSEAVAAFKKIEQVLQDDGATVKITGPGQHPPALGIQAVYGEQDAPTFAYILRLRPDADRPLVMREYTVPTKPHDGGSGRKTETKEYPFFDEQTDGRSNHAPEITEADIINDFTKLFTAHRKRDWPKSPVRQTARS